MLTVSDMFVQLIAAAFRDRTGASRALDAVLRARAHLPRGILDAAAITRGPDGALLVQAAAERAGDGGFAVWSVTGVVLGLMGGAAALEAVPHDALPARATRTLKGQLRDVAALLTPATSALVALVGPSGAAEVAGVVLDEAVKLAVEDLPGETVFAMAGEPALVFSGAPGAAVLRGTLPVPHTAFAGLAPAPLPPG
ncbi:MAG TPA: hypothetical protein VF092_19805 [Longimicrobium sp.]